MKFKKLAAAAAFALAATTAQAGLFDPDGAGGLAPINLGTFDWGPTSFLALNGQQAIANFIGTGGGCPAGSCSFEILSQARLTATLAPNGTVNTPSGLGTAFEITLISRFTETVTSANPLAGTATFQASPGGFLQMFFDAPANAHDLTGFGFDDGRLILTATLANTPSGFFFVTDPLPVALDQNAADDYPGQGTVQGTGSNGNFTLGVTGQDGTFFIDPLAAFGLQFANISIGLPFISVDPADCFDGTAFGGGIGTTHATSTCNDLHVLGPMFLQGGGGGVIPNIGIINGLFFPGFTDFIAQTDFNSPVRFATTPEPGSLALLGVGLLGMAAGLRRKWLARQE